MFIFWDNSNIHISGLKAMEQKEPDQLKELFRTNFKNLFELVRNNREVESAYLSGSIPPPNNALWDYLKNMGINLQLLNKTAEGTEQESVDMSLQTMMLRTAMDHMSEPSTIAILTGDGAGKQLGEGFLSDLKRIKNLGWKRKNQPRATSARTSSKKKPALRSGPRGAQSHLTEREN